MPLVSYEVPLSARPQVFRIALAGTTYQLTVRWNDALELWVLDIATGAGAALLLGLPLVTGIDLLAPYKYLNLGGSLLAQTDGDPTAPPDADNLGTAGRLYFVVFDATGLA